MKMNNLTTTVLPEHDIIADARNFFDPRTTILSTLEAVIDGISNVTNHSSVLSEAATPKNYKSQLLLYDILIPALGSVIILLNLAVVISSGLILKRGQQPRSTYMFLGNVALTDLITGIAVVFGQLYPKNLRDHYVCATQIGMIVSSTLASVYSVGLIAIDRYLFIIHGLQYQIWVYPTRVRIFIISTWIIGCFIGFLPLMGWYGDTDNGRVCWFILLAPKELILLTVIIGIIPLVVVIVLYCIILYRAIKKIIQLRDADTAKAENQRETNDNGLRIFRGGRTNTSNAHNAEVMPADTEAGTTKRSERQSKAPSKWKAIKVVIFTTGSFVITWSPYFIASLMYGYCYDKQSPHCMTLRILIASPLAILGFVNSLINPVIYAWWHKGFRMFVKKKFEAIKMRKQATQDIAEASASRSTSTKQTSTKSKSSSSNFASASFEPENADLNTRL